MQSSQKKRLTGLGVLFALSISLACQLSGNGLPVSLTPTQNASLAANPSPAATYELYVPALSSQTQADSLPQAFVHPCLPENAPETAQVSEVVDGDTLHVVIQGKEFKLRYIGINAPENTLEKEPYGLEATERNRQLVEGKTVTLIKDISETDRFGRLLRYVLVDDIFINLVLVQGGFARAKSYPPDTSCDRAFSQAEQEARSSARGLWAVPTATSVPLQPTGTSLTGTNCDTSYPEVCISSPPPDLDCKDIPFRKFKVLAPDPHHFDVDGNGIGCEEP